MAVDLAEVTLDRQDRELASHVLSVAQIRSTGLS